MACLSVLQTKPSVTPTASPIMTRHKTALLFPRHAKIIAARIAHNVTMPLPLNHGITASNNGLLNV